MSFIRQFTGSCNLCDGVYHAYARAQRPKLIWGALIGAGVSLASSLIGGSQSSSANKEAERQSEMQKASNDAWYKRRYNESYLDTSAGQNLLRQARELADRQTKKVEGSAAVGGSTDAAVAQAKENANKVISDTASNISAHDTARKDNADAIHRQDNQNYSNQKMQFAQNRANNIAQAASGMSNAVSTAASLLDGANTKKSVAMPKDTLDNV